MTTKYAKFFVLFSALVLFLSLNVLAREKNKNEMSVNIPDTVQLGTTQLQPGTYKVEWTAEGPGVQVNFLQHGKTVATAPGTLKTNDAQVTQDDVVTQKGSHGEILQEIDFRHQKEALVFGSQVGM